MTLAPLVLRPMAKPPCLGAPTISSASLSDSLDVCAGSGWDLNVSITLSGALPAGFEIEAWSKQWKDAESEPGSYTYRRRYTAAGTQDLEEDSVWGSDGGFSSETRRRKAQIRIVPAGSAPGAGPFCDSYETSQLNRLGYDCVA